MSERKSILVTGLGLGGSILSKLVKEGRAAGLLDEEIHSLGDLGNQDIQRIMEILAKEKMDFLEKRYRYFRLFPKLSTVQWYVADIEYDLGLNKIMSDLEKLPSLGICTRVFPVKAFQSKEDRRKQNRIYVLNFKEPVFWKNILNCLRDIGLRLAFPIEIAYLSEKKELQEKRIYGNWFYANPFHSPVTLFNSKIELAAKEDKATCFAAVER